MTMSKEDLIKFCRYFKGEVERPKDAPLWWGYEQIWVELSLNSKDDVSLIFIRTLSIKFFIVFILLLLKSFISYNIVYKQAYVRNVRKVIKSAGKFLKIK